MMLTQSDKMRVDATFAALHAADPAVFEPAFAAIREESRSTKIKIMKADNPAKALMAWFDKKTGKWPLADTHDCDFA